MSRKMQKQQPFMFHYSQWSSIDIFWRLDEKNAPRWKTFKTERHPNGSLVPNGVLSCTTQFSNQKYGARESILQNPIKKYGARVTILHNPMFKYKKDGARETILHNQMFPSKIWCNGDNPAWPNVPITKYGARETILHNPMFQRKIWGKGDNSVQPNVQKKIVQGRQSCTTQSSN